MSEQKFDSIEAAIEDIAAGKMVIVADDANRENEGDLVCAAEKISPEIINFMTKFGRGLICLTLENNLVKKIELDDMVRENTDAHHTAFTISIDADPKFGVSTGISASDRSKTIEVAVANDAKASDLRRPGHIFPLKAVEGGVLKRVGHTEASVDLARLAGLKKAGVICEILKEDGEMARRDDLFEFAKEHDLKFITIADLVAYRLERERFVKRIVDVDLPNKYDEDFRIYGYIDELSDKEHVALVHGDINKAVEESKPVLVRVHSECLTGDLFGSLRCDCGTQLDAAIHQIRQDGCGVLVYLRQEGRGIGLLNKLKAYELQDQGHDTVDANLKLGFPADLRTFGVGAQILSDLGLTEVKILTNNPKKIHGISGYGLKVVERVPLKFDACKHNEKYLEAKKNKLGHLL